MRNKQKIKRLLRRTGWLQVSKSQVVNVVDDDPRFILAVKEYGEFHSKKFHQCCLKHNGVLGMHDGIIGPGYEELFGADRCGEPDRPVFGKPLAATASASRNSWKEGCVPGWENVHTYVVHANKSGMPAFLGAKDDPNSLFEQAWELSRLSYWNIGLACLRADLDSSLIPYINSRLTFKRLRGSTIGLATVGNNPKCSTEIWMQYDPGYHPNAIVSEWSTLLRHEKGHNVGLRHYPGGTMNSGIISGLDDPDQWRDDPAFSQLEDWFTGVAVVHGKPPISPPTDPTPTGHYHFKGTELYSPTNEFLENFALNRIPPPFIGG